MTAGARIRHAPSERGVVGLVAAIQFIVIVDFMMVAPLGPDLAVAIGMPTSQIGLVVGSYTLAAASGSLLAASWLDRLDRRAAVVGALLGQAVGAVCAVFAWNLETLIAARILGGLFAGPATSAAFAILLDAVPVERRGRAIGAVMGAFSLAAILGVPVGLELARVGGWHAPFAAIAISAAALAALAAWRLPPLRGHLAGGAMPGRLRDLFRRADPLLAFAAIALQMLSGFLLIPYLSTFYQLNLGYPRDALSLLYLVGGAVSFFTMRLAGRYTDRIGSFRVATAAVAGYLLVLYGGFYVSPPWVPVLPLFVAFMVVRTSISISVNTLITAVPQPAERASFMAVKTAVQHFAGSAAAIAAAEMLGERPDGSLTGMPQVALLAMALSVCVPLILRRLQARLRERA